MLLTNSFYGAMKEDASDCDSQNSSPRPSAQVYIKPRPYVHVETEQDFFVRKPHMTMENWNDALASWNVRFGDTTVSWTAREQRKHALQSLGDINKFCGNDQFSQNVLDKWEVRINSVLEQAVKVWTTLYVFFLSC